MTAVLNFGLMYGTILCFGVLDSFKIDVLLDAETKAEVANVSFQLNETSNGTAGNDMELQYIVINESSTTNQVCSDMKNDTDGVIYFSSSCRQTLTCISNVVSNGMPTIIVSQTSCTVPAGSSVPLLMYPYQCCLTQMVNEIVSQSRLSADMIFIFNTDTDIWMKQLTEEVSISSMNTRIHILHTSQIQSEYFTSELYRCKPCRYVLLCDEQEIQMIMRKASEADLLDYDRYWIIFSQKVIDDLRVDITSIYASNFIFICPEENLPVFYIREAIALFEESFTAFNTKHNGTRSTWHHRDFQEGINMTNYESRTPTQMVYSTYQHVKDRVIHVANWSSEYGLNMQRDGLFQNSFIDFGNTTLTIAAQEAKPFNIRHQQNGTVFWNGFCFDILDELAKSFNFSYRIVEPPDGKWGAPNEDGTWNGMVGMVYRGEVDFAVGPFTITSIRETVIDFTKPYMEDGAGILTRRPKDDANKMFQMFKPFALIVWFCVGISIIVVGVLLFVANRFSPFTKYNRKEKFSSKDEIRLLSSMWLIFAFFMEQGGEPLPSAISGRCILGFWWIFTILIMSTYTANLAAFLTVTIAERPINSLEELVAQSEIKPLVKVGTNMYTLFKSSSSGIYESVWEALIGTPKVPDTDSAINLVRTENFAYMTDYSQLEFIMLNECDVFALAEELFNTAGYGFVLPDDAPFMDKFNEKIMRMQEAGLIEKWHKKWWTSNVDTCLNTGRTSSAETLDIESLSGLFFVYLAVVVISTLALIIEVLILKNKHSKMKVAISRSEQSKNQSNDNELQMNSFSLKSNWKFSWRSFRRSKKRND